MQRRHFLTGLAAPLILGAQNKSGSRKPVLGSGAHTYEVTHDWGACPANIKYGNTHGVCVDSQGRVYIHHTVNDASESHDTMVVFDRNGRFIKSWGAAFRGGAHGLHIRKEGNQEFLYLCDTRRAVVVKSTLDGEEVFMLGYPSMAEPYSHGYIKYSPTNIAIALNGDLYVGDGYGSSYINQYSANGDYIRTFGGKGSAPGQLDCPHGLIVDTRHDPHTAKPVLLVADRGNHRIQRFTLDGKHIDYVAGTNLPCHFNFNRNGDAVVPDLGARVSLFDKDNNVIEHLGDDSQSKWSDTRKLSRDHFTPGKFVCPHGACFDHEGNIFVVEWVEVGRVSKLTRV
jgi:hypothetical protein